MASRVATLVKRGNPSPQHEIFRRVNYVELQLTKGTPNSAVIHDCMQKWGCSQITVERYMARVRERWVNDRRDERATDVEVTIQRLTRAANKLESKRAWAPWMQAEKLLADVKGVLAPQKHEHKVAAVVAHIPVAVPPEALHELSDDALEQLERAADKARIPLRTVPALPAVAETVIDVPSSE